ncbi:hypothetical protein LTR28_006054 [Elasticomyces elasticus]|nr:hypothetical protein LTR28_006054 [Elasticomyces elasticus]
MSPTIQAEFEERNHLSNPKVIRASSNRPNIFHMVQKAERRGSLQPSIGYTLWQCLKSIGQFNVQSQTYNVVLYQFNFDVLVSW